MLTSRCLESPWIRVLVGAVSALLLHAWVAEWPRLLDVRGALSFAVLTAVFSLLATLLQRLVAHAFRHEDRAPVTSLRFLWPLFCLGLLFGLRAGELFVFNSFGLEVKAEWQTKRGSLSAIPLATEPGEPLVRGSSAFRAVLLPPLHAALEKAVSEAEGVCTFRLAVLETERSDVDWIPLYRGWDRSFQLVLTATPKAARAEDLPAQRFERSLRLRADFRGLCDARTAETLIAKEARDRLVPALDLEVRAMLAKLTR